MSQIEHTLIIKEFINKAEYVELFVELCQAINEKKDELSQEQVEKIYTACEKILK